jgi:hypothetical protein
VASSGVWAVVGSADEKSSDETVQRLTEEQISALAAVGINSSLISSYEGEKALRFYYDPKIASPGPDVEIEETIKIGTILVPDQEEITIMYTGSGNAMKCYPKLGDSRICKTYVSP